MSEKTYFNYCGGWGLVFLLKIQKYIKKGDKVLLFATGDLGAAAQFQNAEAMSSMSGDTCLRMESVQPHRSRPARQEC